MTTTDAVKKVLLQNVEARTNTAVLFAEVCILQGIQLPNDIARAPKPETVGRLAHRVKTIFGWRDKQ
jgi:hypothetical protein